MRACSQHDRRRIVATARLIALPALVLALWLPLPARAEAAPAPQGASQLQQQEAALLLARGRHLLAQGEIGQALAALRKAARLDPENATCQRLVAQAERAARMGSLPSSAKPIKEQYAARARSIVRQAEHSLFDAKKALDGKDYDRAAQYAQRALTAIRYLDGAERGAKLRASAESILASARSAMQRDRSHQRQLDLAKARADGAAARRERNREAPGVTSLRSKARKHHLDGEYSLAAEVAREVQRLAPDDEEAKAIEERALEVGKGPKGLAGRSNTRARREDDLIASLEREATPHPDGKIVLPGKAKARAVASAGVRRKPMEAWERELRAKLEEEVSIDFKQTPLEDCVKQLAAIGKVNIVLDPAAARETPITIEHTRMPLDALLRWVARFASLRYCVRDGAVLLTTGHGALDEPVRRVYNITSLVIPEDDAVPTAIIDASIGMAGPVEPMPKRRVETKPTEVNTDGLGEGWASFLRDTVAPGTWNVGSRTLQEQGPRYTIQYRNGRIVVVHTPDVHEQIEELLNNFRRARNLQVHILGRFLQVEQTFIERLTLGNAAWSGPDANGPGVDPDGGKRYAFTPISLTNDTNIIRTIADPLDPTAASIEAPLARFASLNADGGLALSWDYVGVFGHNAQALLN
ncbi:hypothetical protein HQ576_03350, partial [bacterium]|nr:hypothetical protein [bacterium]